MKLIWWVGEKQAARFMAPRSKRVSFSDDLKWNPLVTLHSAFCPLEGSKRQASTAESWTLT